LSIPHFWLNTYLVSTMMKVTRTALAALALLCSNLEVEARLHGRDLQLDEEPMLELVGNDGEFDTYPLGLCQGECDTDEDCAEGLYCFQRDAYEPVPGCGNKPTGAGFDTRADYCVQGPNPADDSDMTITEAPEEDTFLEGDTQTGTASPSFAVTEDATVQLTLTESVEEASNMEPAIAAEERPDGSGTMITDDIKPLQVPGNNGEPADAFPLQNCQGDCDDDSECAEGLFCWLRDYEDKVPGCVGGLLSVTDFCVEEKYRGMVEPSSATSLPAPGLDDDMAATDAGVGDDAVPETGAPSSDAMELSDLMMESQSPEEATAFPDEDTAPPTTDLNFF